MDRNSVDLNSVDQIPLRVQILNHTSDFVNKILKVMRNAFFRDGKKFYRFSRLL